MLCSCCTENANDLDNTFGDKYARRYARRYPKKRFGETRPKIDCTPACL